MKNKKVEYYISILSIIISIAGTIISIQANLLARQSNKIAEQANSIAFKATNPEISLRINSQVFSFALYGCHFYVTDNYQTYVVGTQEVIINNSGGNDTSLIDIDIINSGYKWQLWFYGDKEKITQLELPYDIPAGTSRKIYITAGSVTSEWQNSPRAPQINPTDQYADFLNQNVNWQWLFEFGNTDTGAIEFTPIPSNEPNLEFDLNLCRNWEFDS